MKEKVREILKTDFAKVSGLNLNALKEGTDEYRAVFDAAYFAGKRQSAFWSTFGSAYIDGDFGFRYNDYVLYQAKEIETRLGQESAEYKMVFEPVNNWLSQSILDDGIATGGQRFRFVCDALGKDWSLMMNHSQLPGIRQVGQEKV